MHKCSPYDHDEDMTLFPRSSWFILFICVFIHFSTKIFQHLPHAKHWNPGQWSAGGRSPCEMPFKKLVPFKSQPTTLLLWFLKQVHGLSVLCFLTCKMIPSKISKCNVQWCAGKCLTTGSLGRPKCLVCSTCQFPWCKCSHHGHCDFLLDWVVSERGKKRVEERHQGHSSTSLSHLHPCHYQ